MGLAVVQDTWRKTNSSVFLLSLRLIRMTCSELAIASEVRLESTQVSVVNRAGEEAEGEAEGTTCPGRGRRG